MAAKLWSFGRRLHFQLAPSICLWEALMSATCQWCSRPLPHVQLYDHYGPTEGTIEMISLHCTPESVRGVKTIGELRNKVTCYMSGSGSLSPVPLGIAGELLLKGRSGPA